MDREGRVESDLRRVFAQQARADGMKGAGPGERVAPAAGVAALEICRDPLDAARHLGCRAARKGQQHNAPRIGAVGDEVGDPVRQRVGLARTRAGDDQQRSMPRRSPTPPYSTARRCSGLRWARGETLMGAGQKVETPCGARMRLGRCAVIAREHLRPCASLRSCWRLPRLNRLREQITNEKTSSHDFPRPPISLSVQPGYSGWPRLISTERTHATDERIAPYCRF